MQATQTFSMQAQQVRRKKENVSRSGHGNGSNHAGRNTNGTPRKPVLYIYDRVTTKGSKEREMQYRFGSAYQRNYVPRDPRSKQTAARSTSQPHNSSGYTQRNTVRNTTFANTREFYSGGVAAKKRNKLIIDDIINLFETIEDRWVRDMDMAKKQATLHKKFVEHRRGLFLALITLAILAVFIFGVYKLFFVVKSIETEDSANYTSAEIVTASGIGIGDNLYSFKAGDVENNITLQCPYLKNAKVSRVIPTKVLISAEDDTARYYANIFGETLALSNGLKVLGTVTVNDAKAQGLTLLKLPVIDKAVAGRVITFADAKDERYVRGLLGYVSESGLALRIGMVDMRDEFGIIMHCDNTYRFQFGSAADAELKLRMADKILNDSLFEQGTLAQIDLSVVNVTGEASVRYDLRLNLEADE